MSIFSKADSGVQLHKTYFPLNETVVADVSIGKVTPLYGEFMLPGDIAHIKLDIFIRSHPLFAPLLTNLNARVRGWFVPLRLLDENTEFIITGSKNGHFDKDVVVPEFKGLFDDATDCTVTKYSVMDYLISMPLGDYEDTKDQEGLPAQYWLKGYERIFFDWYRDENLCEYDDFEDYWDTLKVVPGKVEPFYSNWSRDYFTSALPFQQKGVRPTFDFNLVNPDDFSTFFGLTGTDLVTARRIQGSVPAASAQSPVDLSILGNLRISNTSSSSQSFDIAKGTKLSDIIYPATVSDPKVTTLTQNFEMQKPGIDFGGLASTLGVDDLRYITQLQRILERAARVGTRYTEYLAGTFGSNIRDDTLQRVQYLGGYKQPITVSSVEQTAEDGSTPVGTLRGKGVSLSEGLLDTFVCKEFGLLYVTLEIMPKALYTQGIRKKYTRKSRWDFYNPSFQFLSEDEIKNSEIYWEFDSSVTVDDKPINECTFGFTEMYNYLKSNQDRAAGEMRDTLSYWTIQRKFEDTPVLSEDFVQAKDSAAFAAPFAVTDAPPFIVEFGSHVGIYRPMARYGTPGLVDHS